LNKQQSTFACDSVQLSAHLSFQSTHLLAIILNV
jgi:hypothetical protein